MQRWAHWHVMESVEFAKANIPLEYPILLKTMSFDISCLHTTLVKLMKFTGEKYILL